MIPTHGGHFLYLRYKCWMSKITSPAATSLTIASISKFKVKITNDVIMVNLLKLQGTTGTLYDKLPITGYL